MITNTRLSKHGYQLLVSAMFTIVVVVLLLRGKDETPDIEDLGSVLRDSSIQTLHLPTHVYYC